MANSLSFEEVDAHVQGADLRAFAKGGPGYFVPADVAAAPMDVLKKICEIYRTLRPILNFVKRILPKKWRAVIDTFIDLMDKLCPED